MWGRFTNQYVQSCFNIISAFCAYMQHKWLGLWYCLSVLKGCPTNSGSVNLPKRNGLVVYFTGHFCLKRAIKMFKFFINHYAELEQPGWRAENIFFPVSKYRVFDRTKDLDKAMKKINEFNLKLDAGSKLPEDSLPQFKELCTNGWSTYQFVFCKCINLEKRGSFHMFFVNCQNLKLHSRSLSLCSEIKNYNLNSNF
jgi:hypothetical protein